MTQYIDRKRYPITCPFGVPRPTLADPSRTHEGEDTGCPRGTPLMAPEPGFLQYAVVRQHGDWAPDFTWPDGAWWPYSRYYEWWAGGLAILYGSQYTHVWLHIDPSWIYSRCEKAMVMLTHQKSRKPGDYSAYVIAEVIWQPGAVREGDVVAASGVSGYDSAPHVHYQLMAPGRNAYQVLDPRAVFPS